MINGIDSSDDDGVQMRMDKLKQLWKNREVILYLVFGVLTTIVNYIVYFSCTSILGLDWSIANVFAWVFAVAFAYLTNRIWVFESKKTAFIAIIREIILFVGCRILSFGFDMGTMFVCMDLLHMEDWVVNNLPVGEFMAKTLAQGIVVISNYVFSKWIIFKKETV